MRGGGFTSRRVCVLVPDSSAEIIDPLKSMGRSFIVSPLITDAGERPELVMP